MILKPFFNRMYRVQLINISKSFGGITALKNVTLKVKPGEIHALAGENGAGKSTLMKILSGAVLKDTGSILIDDTEVSIRDTYDSQQHGIGIIYQEFSLVPDLSIIENIYLRQLGKERSWMNWQSLKKKADMLLESIGFRMDTSIKVSKLSVAHQQIVEIAKALSEEVKILILDEPSAVLGPHEIQKLFDTLLRLKKAGVSIIYITHHLSEIFQIADRVSILKDGISGESLKVTKTDHEDLIRRMLGRSLDTMYPKHENVIGDEMMRVESINQEEKLKDISLLVRSGEILGIAGLVGSGRTETLRAIFGAAKTDKKVLLKNKIVKLNSPHQAVNHGIGMIPEDRKQQGIIPRLSVMENISLSNLGGLSDRLGFIRRKKEQSITRELIQKLTIKTARENSPAGSLSGGNQQKVSLAKWIGRDCQVMLIDEPTRGIDVGAKVEIYHLINELAGRGVAIIIVSSETAELMGLCDRILVMRKGKIQGELARPDFSEENILRLSLAVSRDSTTFGK